MERFYDHLDSLTGDGALRGSVRSASFPSVQDLVESSVSFLYQLPVPDDRSNFFRMLASRLLELADDPPPHPEKLSPGAPLPPTMQTSPSSAPPRRKKPKLVEPLDRLSSSSLQSQELTFDRLPPDVIVSHIFRFMTGTFNTRSFARSNHTFLFTLGVLDKSRIARIRQHASTPPDCYSCYEWTNPTNRSVRCLWGYFCRDVFRHPWFLFESLELPSSDTFYSEIDFSGGIHFILPKVVISPKMIFSLHLPSLNTPRSLLGFPFRTPFGGAADDDNADGSKSEKFVIRPPSSGFIHLNCLTGPIDPFWLRFVCSPIVVNRHIRTIRSRRTSLSQILALDGWEGERLTLAIQTPFQGFRPPGPPPRPLPPIPRPAVGHPHGVPTRPAIPAVFALRQRPRHRAVADPNDDASRSLDMIRDRDWHHLRSFRLRLVGTVTLPNHFVENMKNLTDLRLEAVSLNFGAIGGAGGSAACLRGILWSDNLKSLCLKSITTTWRHVLRSLEKLEKLTIVNCVVDDEIFRIHRMPKLKFLNLCCRFGDDDGVFCENPSEQWLVDPSTLLKLQLGYVPPRVIDFFLVKGWNLERLLLHGCVETEEAVCRGGWKLSSLSYLSVKRCGITQPNLILDFPTRIQSLLIETVDAEELPPFLTGFVVGRRGSQILSDVKSLHLEGKATSALRVFLENENDFPKLQELFLAERPPENVDVDYVPPWFLHLLTRQSRLVSVIQLRLLQYLIQMIRRTVVSLFMEEIRIREVIREQKQTIGPNGGVDGDGWLRMTLSGLDERMQVTERRRRRMGAMGGRIARIRRQPARLLGIGIGADGSPVFGSLDRVSFLLRMLEEACGEMVEVGEIDLWILKGKLR